MNIVKIKSKLKKNDTIRKYYDKFRIWSIKKALEVQGLHARYNQIQRLNINITNQYSNTDSTTEYIKTKILGLHSFQMMLFAQFINNQDIVKWKVIDLGDSSGVHAVYMNNLFGDYAFNTIGVNIDIEAVKRIESRGVVGCCCDIQDYINWYSPTEKQDTIITMFETLEHLENPIEVLKGIKQNIKPKALILTVPFVRRSRVGLHHLRNNLKSQKVVNQENNHIFELSPEDWMFLFEFTGFKVKRSFIYYQYPYNSWIPGLKYFWEKTDFEGFFGAILE